MNIQKFLVSVTLTTTMALASTAQAQLLGGGGSLGGSLSGGMAGGLLNGSGSGSFGGNGALDSTWATHGADQAVGSVRESTGWARQTGADAGNRTKAAAAHTDRQVKSGLNGLAAKADDAASGSATTATSGTASTHDKSGAANTDSTLNSPLMGDAGASGMLGTQGAQPAPSPDKASGGSSPGTPAAAPSPNRERSVSGEGNAEASAHGADRNHG